MTDVTKLFHSEDLPALNTIITHRGSIFGGYLRDIIAGDEPTDIDAVLYENEQVGFDTDMRALGYIPEGTGEQYDTVVYSKPGARDVEVYFDEEEPNCVLGPCAGPDAEVNLLAYVEGRLINWATMEDVEPIVELIRRKETHIFDGIDAQSLAKLQRKGYRILGSLTEP
jgi:hypothetical protein